jgi:hypothetical protein
MASDGAGGKVMLRRFGTEYRPSYVGISSSDKERFLAKYAEAIPVAGPLETPCLRWPDAIGGDDYGRFYARKDHLAHRIAWLVWKGEIPDGLFVCHRCDNPWCVNVDHLFLGTCLDNHHDMIAKGRRAPQFGEHHPSVKLTADQVREIYHLAWSGRHTLPEIGNEYGVSFQYVSEIKHRKKWRHLWEECDVVDECSSHANAKLTEDQVLTNPQTSFGRSLLTK